MRQCSIVDIQRCFVALGAMTLRMQEAVLQVVVKFERLVDEMIYLLEEQKAVVVGYLDRVILTRDCL
jgi:hypothetical protein